MRKLSSKKHSRAVPVQPSGWLASRLLRAVTLLCGMLAAGCGGEDPAPPPVVAVAARQLQLEQRIPDPDVVKAQLQQSIHAVLECTDCHVPAPGSDSQSEEYYDRARTRCSNCHEEAAARYDQSVHGTAIRRGASDAARCVNCHGSHDIVPIGDPRSPVYASNLPETCGRCHSNPELARELGIRGAEGVSHYPESVHGAELAAGNRDAPSCVDCHGKEHGVFRASNPRSTVHRRNVPATCGKCHEKEIGEFRASVHAAAVEADDPNAPTCITCHTSHSVVRPTGKFKLASDRVCGECHAERLSAYLETYHGRAHDLKSLEVAACFDCHGKHRILPSWDPSSRLAPQNRGATCRECHPGAPDAFMSFMAHGDYKDRDNYPMLFWAFVIMTSLIVGTFAIWGVHTALWVLRSYIVYRRDPRRFKEEKRKAREQIRGRVYVRFRAIDRFCHLLIIVSFFLLVLTGMPLKFHDTWWAQWIFDMLGGARRAAVLHRVGAVISGIYLLLHVTSLVGPTWRRVHELRARDGLPTSRAFLRVAFGPDSPLPNRQDLRDLVGHLRWFLGRGPKPQFDRFTYWEKFDYFAELWGSAFIGMSGLVMWFPEKAALFIPGWSVNLAQVVHSQEALLAAGFILTFHFFNSHFRLEKFPLDSVMFSGRISEEEMRHERARQLERLAREGRLDEIAAQGDWAPWKRLLTSAFGLTALVLGTVLAILMFWALAGLWLGA